MSDSAMLRERFPILSHKTYLNTCSYGALSIDVEASLKNYIATRNEQGADWDEWIGKLKAVRERLGRILNVPPHDLAITSSLSEAVNALSSALRFDGPRRKIVVTELDFPTTAQIWRAQAVRGAEIVTAAAPQGRLDMQDFDRLVDDRTALISVPSVCYWNGATIDLPAIVELAHARGAAVLVDAFQSVGTYPFDALASGADFVAGGCTKYLIGGSGLGFLYVRDSMTAGLAPTRTGWFAQRDPNAMNAAAHEAAADARRFEAGTPSVASLYCAEAGLALLASLPAAAIWEQITSLTDQIKSEAQRAGLTLATPMERGAHGAMIAIRAVQDTDLVTQLSADGVILTSRAGNLRVSPHFYNNAADIDALFAALRRHHHLVG